MGAVRIRHSIREFATQPVIQSMRTVGKMCLDLAIGVLRALFQKAPVRQGRIGAKFAKRQLFFDTQIFLFRIQKVIFGIHTAVRQGFNVGFCQSKCSVVFSFREFSSTFQVGPIDRPLSATCQTHKLFACNFHTGQARTAMKIAMSKVDGFGELAV